MNTVQKSLFNLIAVFRTSRKTKVETITATEHCDKKYHHDFYCDAEQPFIREFK